MYSARERGPVQMRWFYSRVNGAVVNCYASTIYIEDQTQV